MTKSLLLFAAVMLALLLGASLHSEGYVLEGQKWPNGNIVMNLQLNTAALPFALPTAGLQDGSASWNAVAEAALAEWNKYLLNVQFTFNTTTLTPMKGDTINSVFFDNEYFQNSFGSGVLGITVRYFDPTTNTTTGSDTIINTAFQWNSYRGNLQPNAQDTEYIFDLRRVLDHEFGHNLGLNHPDLATPPQSVVAIMNSVTSDLDHIELDDIEGVWSMYGQKTVLEPVTVTVTPPLGGTVSPVGSLQLGSTPVLTATPAAGYVFVQWDDGTTSPTRSITVGLGGGSYTATFAQTLDAWKDVTGNNVGSITNVIYAKGRFYAFGSNGTATSTDGVTWTTTTSNATLSGLAERVAYGNGLFVAGDYYGNIYTSTDGITWVTSTNVGVNLAGLGFGNGMFVAGGYTSGNTPTPILTSTDALHWTSTNSGLSGYSLNAVKYANGTFVLLGGNSSAFASTASTDGQTWTATTGLGSGYGATTLIYGEGNFVASCGFGTTLKSADGVNWTYGNVIGSGSYYDEVLDLAYGDGTFIALSDNISSSTDGATWTQRVFNQGVSQGRIAFGVNTFVVQTGGSLVETSVLAPAGGQPVLPVINSATTRQGTSNFPLSYQITATNMPLAFNAVGLPAGVSINEQTGAIAGTPTVSGTFPVTLFATNDAGSGTMTLTVTVAAGATPVAFSAWATANNVTGSMSDAPRGDGVPNLLKYFFDIDPKVSLTPAARASLPVFATASAGTQLTLKFPENKILTGFYPVVQTSTDMVSWSTPTGWSITATGQVNGNDDQIMVAQVPVTAGNQYIRLVITPQ